MPPPSRLALSKPLQTGPRSFVATYSRASAVVTAGPVGDPDRLFAPPKAYGPSAKQTPHAFGRAVIQGDSAGLLPYLPAE